MPPRSRKKPAPVVAEAAPVTVAAETGAIVVRGARQHNLTGFDLAIPRDRLVVITGLSGSGKSSLAFDTLYAEGQRRYVESLSAYARQFLERMEKPDVDSIEGLSPAISIEQRTASRNPRSTVGTVTEVHDYLRLLFARVGIPHCPSCGKRVASQSPQAMVDQVMAYPEGSKVQVLAPYIQGRKGEFKRELASLAKQGYLRLRIDGELRSLDESIELDKKAAHSIEVIVDRLVVKPGVERRLSDSIETALALAQGVVRILGAPEGEELMSERFACEDCGTSLPELSPRMFSFNSPYGACPACDGLGSTRYLDSDLIVRDPEASLRDGAVGPLKRSGGESKWAEGLLEALARHYDFDLDTPWKKLPAKVRKVVLHGSGRTEIEIHYRSKRGESRYRAPWEGVFPNLERRYASTESEWSRNDIERYMSVRQCEACGGARLRPESLAVQVGGQSIRETEALAIHDAVRFLEGLRFGARDATIAGPILKEAIARLRFLEDVGLEYLTLERGAATLSGGEAQRIRLATQIGSALVGVLYILDEPSIGLHSRDHQRLIGTLERLRDLGNTVIVVEHDEATMRAADWIVDLGPGAGRHGGSVVAAGPPEQVQAIPSSLTGQYLSGSEAVPVPSKRREPGRRFLALRGARQHNLTGIDLRIPLGLFTCVTGVSGSGKSTLIRETLYPALMNRLHGSTRKVGAVEAVEGIEHLDKVIDIDQSPIGRTPRSNPATYTGLFGPIRELFAGLPDSKLRGWAPGRYSFNVKGGRCEECNGDGIVKIEMHFLPDIYVTCDTCGGRRYNRETLEVKYKGHSIADVLELTVEQALELLGAIPAIRSRLETLRDVGLGYVHLGQQATTLSGGEAQRVKLARELAKRATGRTVYLLDEPTTGLHFHDVRKLLEVLQRLVEAGNTIIVIEHDLDVIKSADHVIDLGPEGGAGGGRLVAEGPPEAIARVEESHTGRFLAPLLA